MSVETCVQEAVQRLTVRWPGAGWSFSIDQNLQNVPKEGEKVNSWKTTHYIEIRGSLGGVDLELDGFVRGGGRTVWIPQVIGAEVDWTSHWWCPVQAMEAAIGCVRSSGKIWERISTGLSQKER